jgi:hypothetical protein
MPGSIIPACESQAIHLPVRGDRTNGPGHGNIFLFNYIFQLKQGYGKTIS